MTEVSDETKDVLERFIRGFNKKPMFPEEGDCKICDEFFPILPSGIYGHITGHFVDAWTEYRDLWITEYGLNLEEK